MTNESPGGEVSDEGKRELFRQKMMKQVELRKRGGDEWEEGIVREGLKVEKERKRYEEAKEAARKKEAREADEVIGKVMAEVREKEVAKEVKKGDEATKG